MVFPRLKLKLKLKSKLKSKSKGAGASDHSPLNLSLPNLEWDGGTETKLDSLCSIDSLHQSFVGIIFIGGGVSVASAIIITRQLISWYVDGSQNINVLRWCNATLFLRGNWIREEVGWGNLPLELWGEIGKRMVSELDITYFRCVCKQWRSSLPSPTRFPLSLPPPPSCDPDMPYAISEVTIYVARKGSDDVYMQVDQGCLFRLTSYLAVYRDEVDLHEASLLASPTGLKLSQLSFFAKSYIPCMALDSHSYIRRHRRVREWFPRKSVLIYSSNAYGINPSYAMASDLTVVSYLGWKGSMRGRLALMRLGGPPQNWIWDTDFCTKLFVNITTYKRQLCALDRWGRVFVMDYNSLQFTQLSDPLSFPLELDGKSLFEACGKLFMFDYKFRSLDPIGAYKLSLRLRKWVKIEDELRSKVILYFAGLNL